MSSIRFTRNTILVKHLKKFEIEESDRPLRVRSAARDEFIKRIYKEGGKPFVEFVRKHGCTERGSEIDFVGWFEEFLEAVGTISIHEVYTTGSSQVGKTLAHTLLVCFFGIEGKLNTLWFYDKESRLDRNVPLQFRPVITTILRRTKMRLKRNEGVQNNQLFQVDGANLMFSFASTSKPSLNKNDGAAVGSAAASVTADILFLEERSQYPPGAADPLPRRLDASMLITQPRRDLGTPGGGGGIERDIKRCDRWFYPHIQCPNCKQEIALDPKGCLLKQAEVKDATGRKRMSFLSESGRPILRTEDGVSIAYWHHHDPTQPITSAFIGCSNCGIELSSELRQSAFFKCLSTGIRLRRFLDTVSNKQTSQRHKIALHLSPLVRTGAGGGVNVASRLIRDGIEADKPTDWQQQGLGHESESGKTGVPYSLIRDLIGAPFPVRPSTVCLAGADQGRSEDWLWIAHFVLPVNWKRMAIAEVMDQSVRLVVFGGDVTRTDIPDLLKRHQVDYALFDNEPDRADIANNICRKTVFEMADQKSDLNDAAILGTVDDGGIEYPCWKIRSEKFLKQVLNNFFAVAEDGYSLYRLPEAWNRWVGVETSDRSPLTHLSGPSYDPETGRWKRGPGNVDDLYYAAMFCEAAFYLWLMKQKDSKVEMWRYL